MKQNYLLTVLITLLISVLSFSSVLAQSDRHVEPLIGTKPTSPYFGLSVSVPVTKIFKPISKFFQKKNAPRAQAKDSDLVTLPPFLLLVQRPDNMPPPHDWNDHPGIPEPGGGGVPCNGCGGGTGGGGGGMPLPPPPPDDRFRIPGFRTMDTQLQNLCVPSVMAKVLQALCNKSTSVGDLVLDYARKYNGQGNNILTDGVPSDRIIDFVSDYFNLNGGDIEMRGSMADRIKSDVLNGIPVMIGVLHPNGNGHNILVTGYNHTRSRFIVLDPETGFESEMTTEKMNAVLYRVPLFCN